MNIRYLKAVLVLFLIYTANATHADSIDIYNTVFYAKENISLVQIPNTNGVNNKIYKGLSFLIKKENILKKEKNRILVKDLDVSSYPYDSYVSGWLNLDKFATKLDAKKITKWPFKIWKTYALTVSMDVFEFTKSGEVTFYTLLDVPSEDIYKNYGHVYLIDDIVLVKHLDSKFKGYFQPFAIYDKDNNRLCPIGKDFNKCNEFLTSDKEYNEFYLEKYK